MVRGWEDADRVGGSPPVPACVVRLPGVLGASVWGRPPPGPRAAPRHRGAGPTRRPLCPRHRPSSGPRPRGRGAEWGWQPSRRGSSGSARRPSRDHGRGGSSDRLIRRWGKACAKRSAPCPAHGGRTAKATEGDVVAESCCQAHRGAGRPRLRGRGDDRPFSSVLVSAVTTGGHQPHADGHSLALVARLRAEPTERVPVDVNATF